jgi:hypothetical protein
MVLEWTLAITAVVSAITSCVSAYAAQQANKSVRESNASAVKTERERRIRELSALANRVLATAVRCDGLANDVKAAERSAAIMANTYGGGRSKLQEESVNQTQSAAGQMQEAAQAVLKSDFAKLTDDEIAGHVLKLDGHLAHLERVRDKFLLDLSFAEGATRHMESMLKP